jgi:hypothetical protein
MNYTHLTQDERYQIAILAKAGNEPPDSGRGRMQLELSQLGWRMKRSGMAGACR